MNSKGPNLVALAEARSQQWAERQAWLRSMHVSSRAIRKYGLDKPMSDLAWNALAREVVRYAGTMRKGSSKRTKYRKGEPDAGHGTSPK